MTNIHLIKYESHASLHRHKNLTDCILSIKSPFGTDKKKKKKPEGGSFQRLLPCRLLLLSHLNTTTNP